MTLFIFIRGLSTHSQLNYTAFHEAKSRSNRSIRYKANFQSSRAYVSLGPLF